MSRRARPSLCRRVLSASGLAALVVAAWGCDLETCDPSVFRSRCDGKVAVSCPRDKMLPVSFQHRQHCSGACVAHDGEAVCVDAPPTRCQSSRCEGRRAVYCWDIGGEGYEVSTQCSANEVCELGLCSYVGP